MTFGEKIKAARQAKHYTQKQLADMVHAKHNSISDWESDRYKPDMDTIERLCGVLDITPTYIMGVKDDAEYGNLVGNIMNDTALMDMIEIYKSLPPEDQQIVRRIITALKKDSRG